MMGRPFRFDSGFDMDDIGQQTRPLTLPEVAALASVQYRTLHAWVRRGFVEPSIQASSGSGSPNLFTRRDALNVRILADLRRAGVSLATLDRTAAKLKDRPADLRADSVLVINGHVSIMSANEQLSAALSEHEPATLYCVGWAIDAVETCGR